MRPVLDYGSSVWDPLGVVLQEKIACKSAVRFVTGNYSYETGSMTAILGQLKLESLKKRRKTIHLYCYIKVLKVKPVRVPTDDLNPKTRRSRNQHSMAFQTPIANTDVYKGSFFPQTIRDWNALPDSLISSAEDANNCVLSSPKLHKRPYKARFIANSSSCTTTELSKLLTSCLTAVKNHVIRYYEKVYERSGKNLF